MRRWRCLCALLACASSPASGQVPGASPPAEQPASLTIGDVARLAAERHGRVDMARARGAQARSRATQQRSALLPNLSAVVQQSSRTINSATLGIPVRDQLGRPLFDPDGERLGPVPTADLRYRLQQSVYDPAAWARWRAFDAIVSASDIETDVQAEAAATGAAMATIRVMRADARLDASYSDSSLAAELLRIARAQLQAGLGIALDVSRAEAHLAQVRAQLVAARNDRQRTMLELQRALGLSLDSPITLRDSLATLAQANDMVDLSRQLALAERNRVELRSVQAMRDAQSQQARAIRLERWPSLGLVADHGTIGRNWEHLLPTYSWGVQLSVPVFDSRRRAARLEEQAAIVRETDARSAELRRDVELEVRLSVLELATTREQWFATRDRLQLAVTEVTQAHDRFRAGLSGNMDVVLALSRLNDARMAEIDAMTGVATARIAMARSIGGVQLLP